MHEAATMKAAAEEELQAQLMAQAKVMVRRTQQQTKQLQESSDLVMEQHKQQQSTAQALHEAQVKLQEHCAR